MGSNREPGSGKNNSVFHYCNGNTNPHPLQNNYSHKPPLSTHRKYSLPSNGKIPLDRMSSVASSQYNANSVLKLVNDNDVVDGHTKTNKCLLYSRRKWPWILLWVIVFALLVTMTTLYVLEKRSTYLTQVC